MTALDWRAPAHWSSSRLPCRHCGAPTNLRDADRRPAHKVCAEDTPAPPAVGLEAAAGAARARAALAAAPPRSA